MSLNAASDTLKTINYSYTSQCFIYLLYFCYLYIYLLLLFFSHLYWTYIILESKYLGDMLYSMAMQVKIILWVLGLNYVIFNFHTTIQDMN